MGRVRVLLLATRGSRLTVCCSADHIRTYQLRRAAHVHDGVRAMAMVRGPVVLFLRGVDTYFVQVDGHHRRADSDHGRLLLVGTPHSIS